MSFAFKSYESVYFLNLLILKVTADLISAVFSSGTNNILAWRLQWQCEYTHSFLYYKVLYRYTIKYYTGWPRNNGTVDTVDFSGLCSNQQLFSSLCWIEHLFPIIITPRSSNLVENFLFYETFHMDCHFRDLPDFQSFEAQWQINGKSQTWQLIRNYS